MVKMFGLRNKKSQKILTVSSEHYSCHVEVFSLSQDLSSAPVWAVKDKLTASYARISHPEWYSASYDAPMNSYDPNELEVVEINFSTTAVDPDPVPTQEEYLGQRYNDPLLSSYQPKHYEFRIKAGAKYGPYTIHDLRILRSDQADARAKVKK